MSAPLVEHRLKFSRRLFSLLGLQVSEAAEIKIRLQPAGRVRSEAVLPRRLENR